jgi:hypothetical protein
VAQNSRDMKAYVLPNPLSPLPARQKKHRNQKERKVRFKNLKSIYIHPD